MRKVNSIEQTLPSQICQCTMCALCLVANKKETKETGGRKGKVKRERKREPQASIPEL